MVCISARHIITRAMILNNNKKHKDINQYIYIFCMESCTEGMQLYIKVH